MGQPRRHEGQDRVRPDDPRQGRSVRLQVPEAEIAASPPDAASLPTHGIAAADRIEVVDALRGLALFGILLANILYWSGWEFLTEADRVAMAGAGAVHAQHFWHAWLIDGKFYTLFSLLFGTGFALQLARLEARGSDGVRLFRRRLLVLLGFGLIHLVFIWDGDILTLYALLGLLLPFVRGWSDRRLLGAALLLILLPVAGVPLFAELGWQPERPFMALSDRIFTWFGGDPVNPVRWLQRDDARGFFGWTLSGWPYRFVTILQSWRIPKVLGIMLVGMVLGRRLAAGTLLDDRRLLVTTLVAGLAVGLPASWAYAVDPKASQASLASLLGTVPLAFAYAAAFVLAWPYARPVLRLLVAPGRMALTNYLSHSLAGIAIFYGIGFGLVGRVTPAQFYGIAAAIFAAQIIGSHLWLARFPQGPMERLWRRLTYGARPV